MTKPAFSEPSLQGVTKQQGFSKGNDSSLRVVAFNLHHLGNKMMDKLMERFSWALFEIEQVINVRSRTYITCIMSHELIAQLGKTMNRTSRELMELG